MHQPLDLGQLGERLRTGPAGLPGRPARIADDQADVAAGTGFVDAGLEPLARFLRLHSQTAQVALVDQQPTAHGIAPMRRQAGSRARPSPLLVGARNSPRACSPRAVVMHQRLEQRIAETLRQFERLPIERAGAPAIATDNRQVAQARQAQQARPGALRGETGEGLGAMPFGTFDIATAPGDDPPAPATAPAGRPG
jgi:hypothetical protein